MKAWWKRRTLKLRLALWYAAVAAVVLTIFLGFVYETVEHRLRAEIDRQLRIDFDLVEAQLAVDENGAVTWPMRGAHGNEGFARLFAWFEVWSDDRHLLLRHWPTAADNIRDPLPAPQAGRLLFRTTELQGELHVRVMERPARLEERSVRLRLFRSETDMRNALAQIVEVSLLVLPLAIGLASLGGYMIAHRSLAPVARMAAQARKISSESLSDRLSIPNPHDELGELATVFNQTLGRLDRSFAELKRFTADAAHELRTPVTALRTVGEVALREGGDRAAQETISSMLEEAQRLQELIESLLTLSRMDSGNVAPQRSLVNLGEVLFEVRAAVDVLAMEKRQTIEVRAEPNVAVLADRGLLRQALMNIAHNAIRYSPSDTRVLLKCLPREGRATIEVTDQGPGIAVEHREKIFDRFFRIDKGRSRDEGGHGLGLAIARLAVEQQGGRIEVESTVGTGSTFRITLPAAEPASPLT